MKCPYCASVESKVLDSRPTEDKSSTRRRRECNKCSKRFTTYEKTEEPPVIVIKRDGTRELFQRQKVLRGLTRSFEKRNVDIKELQNLVSEIEKEMANNLVNEIKSKDLGDMLMEKIKQIDEVAYVRFASVYKDFKDIKTFKLELDKLIK
ncbi:transcriptional regulator NrdR [Proteinivorax hydrogeniformans]|uniref:Transcriptional repressor NrdR n=1 Tax=Proteinivorax hydrogeniformans TaxID=1826727 RepID=A0AAU8HQ18_9FIRM